MNDHLVREHFSRIQDFLYQAESALEFCILETDEIEHLESQLASIETFLSNSLKLKQSPRAVLKLVN